MNSISAILCRSKYAKDKHLVIEVDGKPLDLVAAKFFPSDAEIEGLVPTLLDWLNDEEERAIVWQRAFPSEGITAIFPVLMCPEDADLWCTVVVAEIETIGTKVFWHRVGLDASSRSDFKPEDIGKTVEWAVGLGPFVFDCLEYEKCLDIFRNALGEKV